MTKAELQKDLARLESLHDQLESELMDLDVLMRLIGFTGGLKAVRESAQELLADGLSEQQESA